MIKSEKQLLIVGITFPFSILFIITALYLQMLISGIVLKSIVFGFVISFLNFLIGIILIRYSVDKPEKIFLLALWGGVLFRMILGLSMILISLIFLEINTYGFIFSILFFYVFYLLIEIFYLNFGRKRHFGDK